MISFKSLDDGARILARERRAERNAQGVCINGPSSGYLGSRGAVHGPVVRGGKCQRCIDVHKGKTS